MGRFLLPLGTYQQQINALKAQLAEYEQENKMLSAELDAARRRPILPHFPLALFVLDEAGRCTFAEGGLLRTLGYTPEQAIGRSVFELREYRPEIVADFERALKDNKLHETRELLGQIFDLQYVPLRQPPLWQVSGVAIIAQELSQTHQELRQLQETAKELRRSNEDLERYAFVISHDLQEPLRTIHTYLDFLQVDYGAALDADAQRYIRLALTSAERLKRMIRDLLTHSRMGQMRHADDTFGTIDGGDILAVVQDNLRALLDEQGVKLHFDAPLPVLRGSNALLILLFQNLIENAIKFRRAKPPEIRISWVRAGDFFQFSLQDNGIGFDMKHQARIFELFGRLHTQDEYPGDGIGLAFCKRIVELHEGQIWAEGQRDVGTTIHFTLRADYPLDDIAKFGK